jgi:hypothetical protein
MRVLDAGDKRGHTELILSRKPDGLVVRDYILIEAGECLKVARLVGVEAFGLYHHLLLLLGAVGGEVIASETELRRSAGLSPAKWRTLFAKLDRYFVFDGASLRMPNPPLPKKNPWGLYSKREHIPLALRREVIERDEGVCVYCGAEPETPHLDHIYPVALGGKTDVANLAVACPPCNMSKGAKPLSEWEGPNV